MKLYRDVCEPFFGGRSQVLRDPQLASIVLAIAEHRQPAPVPMILHVIGGCVHDLFSPRLTPAAFGPSTTWPQRVERSRAHWNNAARELSPKIDVCGRHF